MQSMKTKMLCDFYMLEMIGDDLKKTSEVNSITNVALNVVKNEENKM